MKVIFVDASQIVLNTLKTLVQDMIDSKMIVCDFLSDATAVKNLLDEEKLEYDLMFIAINMPQVTGYELAKCAKSKVKYKSQQIIAITTEFSDEAKKRGEASGIDAWFIKSITQDSLQASIINIIKTKVL